MSLFGKQVLIGSMFAFGLASAPAMAQHGGQGRGHGDRQHAEKKASPTSVAKCPVTGEPINLAVSVTTDAGPVFFCCKGCISKFNANPTKYAGQVAAQRRALANRPKIQVTCPVTKEPVDPDVFFESDGKKVYFCCKGCINKYRRDPSKYASSLASSYTYQTKCPVTDEEIDPQAFTTAGNGMNIYFCCKGCDKRFFKDPQKYAPKLVAQGFTVNPKEMKHVADEHAGHGH